MFGPVCQDRPGRDKNFSSTEIVDLPSLNKPPIWKEVNQALRQTEVDRSPDHFSTTGDKIVYVNTATVADMRRAETVLNKYDIDTVYSLGAGDCRVELYLARRGFDVTAYELNTDLVTMVSRQFDEDNLTIKQKDYYKDFDDLVDPDVGFIVFGGNNKPPRIPDQGLMIEGYSEISIRVYDNGTPVYVW